MPVGEAVQSLAEARRRQQEAEDLDLAQNLAKSGFVCMICNNHKPIGDVFRLATCSCSEDQSYCIDCMRGWVQSEIGSQAAGPSPFCYCLFDAL